MQKMSPIFSNLLQSQLATAQITIHPKQFSNFPISLPSKQLPKQI